MKRALLIAAVALLVAGCNQSYPVNQAVQLNTSGSILLNQGYGDVTLTFTSFTPTTVTVNQPPATGSTVYTATPAAACTGVATVAGGGPGATATTTMGPTGSFIVTPVAIAPAGTCTISVTSSITPSRAATITVDTSGA